MARASIAAAAEGRDRFGAGPWQALFTVAAGAALFSGPSAPASAADQRMMQVPGVGAVHVGQRGASTVMRFVRNGRAVRTVLPTDEGIFAGSLLSVTEVGAIGAQVLIFKADYASRPNGASHMCGGGTETMVRVVVLAPKPRQVFHDLVDSCWRSIESERVAWDGAAGELTIERTSFETDAVHRRARYRITAAGVVERIEDTILP